MYINMLDENEKKTYMESIEIKTHYLATHCLTLAKQHRAEDTLFTTKQCTLWCKNKQMDKESCHLINAYIQQNYSVKTKDNNESATTAKGYTILPEGTLRLKKEKHTILQINNLGSSPLTLFVSNLILEQNKNEEIVQFKDGNSQLILDKNKMGEFSIFLEPSYYNQFKSGAYNGHIELTALQGEKNHTIIKKFTFMVE